jgi:UDP-N-acetylmuramyl tripeptide synthase
MTNQEAIKIVEDMIFNMSAEGIRISQDEDKAIKKLIQTAKEFDVLMGIIGICGEI